MIIHSLSRSRLLAISALAIGMGAGAIYAADEAEEEKLFTKMDFDKDGKVTAVEFVRAKKAAAKIGETVDLAALKKEFMALDANEDESLSEIEVHPPEPVAAPDAPKGSGTKKGSAPAPATT